VGGLVEPRITYFALSEIDSSLFFQSSPRFPASGGRNDNVNCDVLAVHGAIFDHGLRTDLELAFHFGVAINQEFEGLARLTLGDLERKGRIDDRRDFPRWSPGCRGREPTWPTPSVLESVSPTRLQ
jgi:hypothetical protein